MTLVALANFVPYWLRPAPDSLWRQMQRTSSMPRLHLLNILWSLWVLATLFFAPVGAAFWWSLGISYPLFALLFALVHVRPHEEVRFYAGLMALVAFVSMLWNPSAWSYAVFACVYTGMASAQSPRVGILGIVMIQAVLLVLAWWLHWPWFVMVMAGSICTSASIGAMFGYMNQMRNVQLRQSHEEIRRLAAANERERIGRDLHDLLGHTLSLITLKLELSRKLFERDPVQARCELCDAEQVARQALAEVRAAVTGIRASDLVAEFASARLLLQSSGVAVDAEAAEALPALPHEIEGGLALIVREAATNVARHAQATHVRFALSLADGQAELLVVDDGCGGIDADGNGLRGIRERALMLGGSVQIQSMRGKGTTLRVVMPLPDERAADGATEIAAAERIGSERSAPVRALSSAGGWRA